jgi:hypothetical protein
MASVPAAGAAGCPNEAIREAQGSTQLVDCMALEMVSPPQKLLAPAFQPTFSRDGSRVTFRLQGGVGQTPGFQSFFAERYAATRGPSGWETTATSPPGAAAIVNGGIKAGGAVAFTPDLSGWTLIGATQAQEAAGVVQLFHAGLDGSFSAFSPLLVPIDNSGEAKLTEAAVNFQVTGVSTDLSTAVLRLPLPTTSYLPLDPRNASAENAPGEDANSYVISQDSDGASSIELLARDKNDKVYGGLCGAHSGGGKIQSIATELKIYQGAVSGDGSRIYFTTRPAQAFDSLTGEGPLCDLTNPLRILKRVETPTGPEITEIAPGAPTAPGDDLYQGASADGTKVYFTSPRKVTSTDVDPSAEECGKELGASKGCDLYLYDSTKPAGERLTQVSAGGSGDPTPGKGADVLSSITAVSGDGTHAYFVAQGVLTTDPNPAGDSAQAGKPNLYLYERDSAHPAGRTAFIGTLATTDPLWGTEGTFFSNAYAVPLHSAGGGEDLGGDGHVLAFVSKAPLTADDTDGAHSDVFRYDAAAEMLERISKAVPGGSDNGAFEVSANPVNLTIGENFGEGGRWVSEDGETIGFATAEGLVPGLEGNAPRPYVWHAGELAPVSTRSLAAAEEPPAVSPDGQEVGFSTTTSLLPQDRDTAKDVYLVRAGGGFLEPLEAQPCDPLKEGSCQGPAGSQPGASTPPSSSFVGPGNVKPKPKCKKGFVKKHGKCVKKHHKGQSSKKRAGHKQGAGR